MTTLVLGLHVRMGKIRAALVRGPWETPRILALETADLSMHASVWPHRNSVGSPVEVADAAVARSRRSTRTLTDRALAVALSEVPDRPVAAAVLGTKHGRLTDVAVSISTRRRAEDADEHLLATLVEGSARRSGMAVVTLSGAEFLDRAHTDLGLHGRTPSAVAASAGTVFGEVPEGHRLPALAGWLALVDYE